MRPRVHLEHEYHGEYEFHYGFVEEGEERREEVRVKSWRGVELSEREHVIMTWVRMHAFLHEVVLAQPSVSHTVICRDRCHHAKGSHLGREPLAQSLDLLWFRHGSFVYPIDVVVPAQDSYIKFPTRGANK